jgi:two-component system chemotaxis sensor kinase CheA
VISVALTDEPAGDDRQRDENLLDRGAIDMEHTNDVRDSQTEQSSRSGGLSDSTIRVDVKLLDKLMNLVGELVLTRNQILQHVHNSAESNLSATAQKLDLLTSELQEGVMKTRMQPIRSVWSKLPRVVRDLSNACGKRVRLTMEGEDTELDKTIVEAIKDPLTHIIRNAVDHGIESPEERLRAGKPEEGLLALSACHEGGQVNIVIADDGAGLSAQRIRDKAIERGLIPRERAGDLSERELVNLIFMPGFSTAQSVTNISGRGVGMDVVKTYIEKIGGAIDVQTEHGKGTILRVRIPLTLAIVPALLIECEAARYAIPQVNVIELVRVDPDAKSRSIQYIHNAPVYRLRGELLPLVTLKSVLQGHGTMDESELRTEEATYIVVLQADRSAFGLVVDRILDTQEIVVKPLSRHFRGVDIYAGATIMGDGGVGMILDAGGLARRVGLTEDGARDRSHRDGERAAASNAEKRAFLLVDGGSSAPAAFPLDAVARLECVSRSLVERAGGRTVLQYRGGLMPLIDIEHFLDPSASRFELSPEDAGLNPAVFHHAGEADINVVVCKGEFGYGGFIVRSILDIVDVQLETVRKTSRSGVSSIAVIQGRTTELLDMEALFRLTQWHSRPLSNSFTETAEFAV